MKASELILTDKGAVYHLGLKPGDLASKIIFVGDQDRVGKVSRFFEKIEFSCQNREFSTHTGWLKGQRISVISTGIGTDNIDIVWNEIDALFNIDLQNQTPLKDFTQVKVLRLGTCGGMQMDLPVGTLVNSRFSVGADGLMDFYDVPNSHSSELKELGIEFHTFKENEKFAFSTYLTEGSADLYQFLTKTFPAIQHGITFTANGFYGPQGRSLGRIPVRYPQLPERLATFTDKAGNRFLNMEMETAGILGLASALGHQAGSLSVILANRQAGAFSKDPQAAVANLIQQGLEIMLSWG